MLKKVTHHSQTSVWWPQQPSENHLWKLFHNSLFWMWKWINSPSLIPNAAGTRAREGGSLHWICVLSCPSSMEILKNGSEKSVFYSSLWKIASIQLSHNNLLSGSTYLGNRRSKCSSLHCSKPLPPICWKGALVTNQHSNLVCLEETEWFWMCFLDGNVLGGWRVSYYSPQARCWLSLVCAVGKA